MKTESEILKKCKQAIEVAIYNDGGLDGAVGERLLKLIDKELLKQQKRVESGSITFGDDWPGLFLRGDDAMMYAAHLSEILSGYKGQSWASEKVIDGLLKGLKSCEVKNENPR